MNSKLVMTDRMISCNDMLYAMSLSMNGLLIEVVMLLSIFKDLLMILVML